MKTNPNELPKKKYVKGAPFIPIWLDEMRLNDAEMHLMIHLWRRGNPCFPSGGSIAKHLGKSEDTIWRLLKAVESKGLLSRQKRKSSGVRNGNLYTLIIDCKPPIQSVDSNTRPDDGDNPRTGRGKKGLKAKGRKGKGGNAPDIAEHGEVVVRSDSNPTPDGAVDPENEEYALPSIETALEWALAYYLKNRHDSSLFIGILRENEILSFTQNWLRNLEITGGKINGSFIRKPRLALETYLEKAALVQSKRCKELSDKA